MSMNSQIKREMTGVERSYRRGVHQALAFAGVILGRARTLDEARELIGTAEDAAQTLRNQPDAEILAGRVALIDEINHRVRAGVDGTY
jgi:hypothetical protein